MKLTIQGKQTYFIMTNINKPELYLSLNKIESKEISVAVWLLAVVENEAVRMMTQEPDLDVEGFANVT